MRLFVAIDVPLVIKEHLAFLQRSLADIAGLRLSPIKQIHLTLNFLGEQISPEEVIKRLHEVRFKPFTLTLSSWGFFPNEDEPKVFWIGLKRCKELERLQRAIDLQFTPTSSFKAHLTLARISPLTDYFSLKKIASTLPLRSLTFSVDCFKLYKSTPTKLGRIYEVVEVFRGT